MVSHTQPLREVWASRVGFLFAMLGAMVGLGNIWRFPYLAGSHGGGAFLFAYIIMVYLIAVPGLMGETAMGRFSRSATVGAFRRMGGWSAPGVLVALGTFGLMTYYFPIIGWVIYYFAHAVAGTFFDAGFDPESAWQGFRESVWLKVGSHALAVLVCAVPLYFGIVRGIERASLMMVPGFILALAIAAARGLTLPGGEAGLAFLFTPDWAQLLKPELWVAALGQALFSTGLGWGIALTLGSYLREDEDIPLGAGIFTAVGDSSIALLAALMVLPTVFAFGTDPAAGPELVFLALPEIFPEMAGGYFWCLLFFVGFLFAALTSGFAITEVPVAALKEETGISRRRAVVWVMGAMWLLGLPSALDLSFNALMDFIFGSWVLPLATLLTVLVLGWRFEATKLRVLEVNYGADIYIGSWWDLFIRYLIPVVIALLLAWFTLDALRGETAARVVSGLAFVCALLFVAWFLGRAMDSRRKGT
jgi:NSS family neurotransmitter:Na+ symporter